MLMERLGASLSRGSRKRYREGGGVGIQVTGSDLVGAPNQPEVQPSGRFKLVVVQ